MRDTIDMAREVKATAYTNRHYPDRTTYTFGPEQLKAFEALVRADEREICANAAMAAAEEAVNFAMALEREACAKVCENKWSSLAESKYGEECADAIRARENT